MLSTFKADDEIFKKDYIAPPIKEKKSEEDTIKIPSKFLEGLPVKKDGKRTKKSRLKILQGAKKLQKDIRKKAERDLIIGEYQLAMANKASKNANNESSLLDQSTKMDF